MRFTDLEMATYNFSDKLIVGSGGSGNVYRGVYSNGQEIVVKKLHPLQNVYDNRAFEIEIRSLQNVNHPNIVRLIDYCCVYFGRNGEQLFGIDIMRFLCYEYMEGGSLDKHINDESCDLDWPTCYKIIRGTCEGLNHLHNNQDRPIFHLGLKPSKIFLDKNRTAKIGDVGLTTLVASTRTRAPNINNSGNGWYITEYMPPEYVHSGSVTYKFDMFSLGVIILKIMAGNKGYSRCYELPPKQFAELVTDNWKERLQSTSGHSSEGIDILRAEASVNIALRCVAHDRHRRPSVVDIVNELEEL